MANRTWNYFICGKEGHFVIACPENNKLMLPAVEPKVNLISLEALVYAITQSKATDEILTDTGTRKAEESIASL